MMPSYWETTKSPYASVLLALPLLVCYEILLLLSDTGGAWQIRNAMDVWVRYVFQAFEIRPQHVTFVLIGILIGALVWLRLKKPEMGLPLNHVGILLLEAFIYSMVLGVLVNLLLYSSVLDLLIGNQTAQKLALSIGAGLYEEFVFRVLLLNGLFFGLHPILRSTVLTAVIAILSASFLFALAHYVGSLGDDFDLHSFLFRWVAGLLFTVLYFVRGFAVTAYTHAFYDIHVLL